MDLNFGFGADAFFEQPTRSTDKENSYETKKSGPIAERQTFEGQNEKEVPKDFCVPVTIKLLLNKMRNSEELRIHDFQISGIIVFGRVCNIKVLASAIVFEICDYTGNIEAKYNKDAKNEKVQNHIENIKVNDYIKIVGVVYSPENKSEQIQISVSYINKVEDWVSYFSYFTCDIIYCNLKLAKLKNAHAATNGITNENKPWSHIALHPYYDRFDEIEIDIFKYLHTKADKESNQDTVFENLTKYHSEINIQKALTKLIEQGEIAQCGEIIAIP
ncbi:nucleic acid binding protein, putative [Hepatocystis sp. ex Piliocolobus tephrosceles]|nr:nucleic acid binding protein, putative [Hepatocystis sp. ex Piliocolobus tephrosceles]